MTATTALGLFSGGLDSILACRLVADQGIRVRALKFVTPFFDHDLLSREQSYQEEMRERYGLAVQLVDLSESYLELLRNPAHGFGKNFNPCIDCKIMMLTRAREMMAEYGASFLVSGEVLGQRPMSQRRDTLNVIARDAVCRDILLRPLSAKLLDPTLPEQQGMVDREQLFGFAGRGRKPQIRLARKLGITEFPAPAGGCILTDPNLGTRIERFYNGLFAIGQDAFTVGDIKLLLVGRQFRLPGGLWLILGRNEQENKRILELSEPGDRLLEMADRPGPLGLLRRPLSMQTDRDHEGEIVASAAGLVVRYGKKIEGRLLSGRVTLRQGGEETVITAEPLTDSTFTAWIV